MNIDQAREAVRQAIRNEGIKLAWVSEDEVTRLALELMVDMEAKEALSC